MVNSTAGINSSSIMPNVSNSSSTSNVRANEFAGMLEQITYDSASGLESNIKNNFEKTVNVQSKTVNNTMKNDISKKNVTNTEYTTTNSDKTVGEKLDIADEVSKAESKIKETLMEKLGVTEEELEAALEKLGISMIECLDSSNLAKLMVELSGSEDMSLILTDETLFMEFTQLSEALGEISDGLLKELNVTKDEFADIITKLKEQLANAENAQANTDGKEVATEGTTIAEDLKTSKGNELNSADSIMKVVTEDNETSENIIVTKNENNQKEYQSSLEKQYDGADDLAKRDAESVGTKKEVLDDNKDNPSPVQAFSERMEAVTAKNNVSASTSSQQIVSPQEILNQINSQIKLAMNADETKMQFQLNPESLGKVTVQVAVKAGVITAQFAAENQVVKEAIEGQIVQLKDSLNNQGLKVEAVEVTIESHEFERNLEDNEKNQENFENERQPGRRQLNYREIDDFEDLSEDEALIAEMMVGNGNTVNYTA